MPKPSSELTTSQSRRRSNNGSRDPAPDNIDDVAGFKRAAFGPGRQRIILTACEDPTQGESASVFPDGQQQSVPGGVSQRGSDRPGRPEVRVKAWTSRIVSGTRRPQCRQMMERTTE
jgi:hypothetical protein